MKIILDAMSGDNAPLEIIKGAVLADNEYPVDIVLVGQEAIIRSVADENGIDISNVEIIDAPAVITMEDRALSVIKEKKDSSMSVGLRMLAQGEADAFVSAGNTGALLAGATLLVRRIKGIHRAAITTIMPFPSPVLLVDSGANLSVTPEDLEQFAAMGSVYMEKIYGIRSPRVGLLNNGTESTKGLPLQVEAYKLLSESKDINFVGNIEAKELPFSACDVVVTDGFTGNIVLKFLEGMGKMMVGLLKDIFMSNGLAKVSALAMKGKLKSIKKNFDASEHGGAPLLGISAPVIKAHGSSDANAIKHAMHQAMSFVNTGINIDIAKLADEFDRRARDAKEAKVAEELERLSKDAEEIAATSKRETSAES